MSNEEIYIATLKEQIGSGMYDKLFTYPYIGERHDLVFLDIGANIGLVSIYAVPYCKRIVAIEPSPETFLKLIENTKNYQIIERDRVALSDSNGEHDFYVNDINFTASSTDNTYGTRITVPCSTLVSLLTTHDLTHVDVCKIDAEGAEGTALDFDQLFRAKDIVDTYFIETHNCPKTSWEHKLGTIVGNLARCGYHKITIEGMAITASK